MGLSFVLKRAWTLCLMALVVTLTACGPDGSHGRVKGSIEGLDEAVIMAYIDDSIPTIDCAADSIHVKRGSFSYDREVSRPTILTLLYPNFSTTTLVVEPGKTVKLKGDANRLSEIEVDGNEDNNLLTEFRKHTLKQPDAEVQREAATFIRSHASSQAAVVLFRDLFAEAENINSNPTESLLKELVKAQPKSTTVQRLNERLQPILRTTAGKPLPAFTGTDLDGGRVSSEAYKGKNTLIVFCAQWDPSFYQIKRYARELNTNQPSGKLSFLFVSLDANKQTLVSANSFDPLPGKVIFDGKALGSPLVNRLGMRFIGGNLLVGTDGTIKARDIPYSEWGTKIPALL